MMLEMGKLCGNNEPGWQNKPSKFFIQKHNIFGTPYIKKIINNATIPKQNTERAEGYRLSASKEDIVQAKGKSIIRTGISVTVPEGCYDQMAPRL